MYRKDHRLAFASRLLHDSAGPHKIFAATVYRHTIAVVKPLIMAFRSVNSQRCKTKMNSLLAEYLNLYSLIYRKFRRNKPSLKSQTPSKLPTDKRERIILNIFGVYGIRYASWATNNRLNFLKTSRNPIVSEHDAQEDKEPNHASLKDHCLQTHYCDNKGF